jgi:hypothetical protein
MVEASLAEAMSWLAAVDQVAARSDFDRARS